MTEIIKVSREELVARCARVAIKYGYTLEKFYEDVKSNTLENPHLRDYWLIYGTSLKDEDIYKSN